MARLLLIDDDFHPTDRTPADTDVLSRIVDKFLMAGHTIGLVDISLFAKCRGKFGISIYNPDNVSNGRGEKHKFNNPSDDSSDDQYSRANMFYAVDAAFVYFERFVTEDDRWNEIDAIVMDINMPPGDLLPMKCREVFQQSNADSWKITYLKKKEVNQEYAGFWLTAYLGTLVKKYRISGNNPNALLPVLMLANNAPEDQTQGSFDGIRLKYACKNERGILRKLDELLNE